MAHRRAADWVVLLPLPMLRLRPPCFFPRQTEHQGRLSAWVSGQTTFENDFIYIDRNSWHEHGFLLLAEYEPMTHQARRCDDSWQSWTELHLLLYQGISHLVHPRSDNTPPSPRALAINRLCAHLGAS